ncbi:MAG: hypothetical protein ACRDA3_03455 [Peptostreptococcaceae bacterium]
MKKNIKNIISFIISLVLMFVIVITSGVLFFRGTMLNDQSYINVLEKNNIYDKIYYNINENLEYLLLTNNIPKDTFEGIILKTEVKASVDSYVYSVVDYMKNKKVEIPPLDMNVYEERFNEDINEFLMFNGMYLNEEFKQNLEEFKSTFMNIIKSDLQVLDFNALSNASSMKAIAKLSGFINSGTVVLGLIMVILVLCLLIALVWRRRKARIFAWVGYSFVSSGLLVLLVGVSGYISGFYNHVAIGIPYLATAVSAIIKHYLFNLSIIGLIVFIIGICVVFRYWIHLYKKYKYLNKLDTSKAM